MTRTKFIYWSICASFVVVMAGLIPAASALAQTINHTYDVDPSQWPQRTLMQPIAANSLNARNEAKPVLASTVIDDMSTDMGWVLTAGKGTIDYSTSRVKTGSRSLALTVPTVDWDYINQYQTPTGFNPFMGYGITTFTLPFATPQDWSNYNRVSFWVYCEQGPQQTNYSSWLVVRFHTASEQRGAPMDWETDHYVELRPGQWNHVVWEFPELPRNDVINFRIQRPLAGDLTGAAHQETSETFYIDQVKIEKVDAEPYVGWAVAPGKIAFNHVGYLPEDRKWAITSADGTKHFTLISDRLNLPVMVFPVREVTSDKGTFNVLDFSSYILPGRYRVRSGSVTSKPFTIGNDIYLATIEKQLNYLYGVRCGLETGIHPACHQDAVGGYNGDNRIINGGWHDAGDGGVQNSGPTHRILVGLMDIYEQLQKRGNQADLLARVQEEIAWGLDYSLRTRFAPGVRTSSFGYRAYSDNTIGTADDARVAASFNASLSVSSAYALARASRLLANVDPTRAAAAETAALEDYNAVFNGMAPYNPTRLDDAAYAALLCSEINVITANQTAADRAVSFANAVAAMQEQHFAGLTLTGYFYSSAARTGIYVSGQDSNQELALLALERVADLYPNHANWIDWYGASALFADYFINRGSQISTPYLHVPHAVWTPDRITAAFNSDFYRFMAPPDAFARGTVQYQDEFQGGTPVGDDNHRLKTFPLWGFPINSDVLNMGFTDWYIHWNGGTNTALAFSAALSSSASLRNSRANETLVKSQLQWLFGGNPFSQSLMYGEGYDFQHLWAPQVMSPPVGSLPVGVTSTSNDEPLWPQSSHITYKEIWGTPQAKLFTILSRIGMPATISGSAPAGAIFTNKALNVFVVKPGNFKINVPAGEYTVLFGTSTRKLSITGGADLALNLDPKNWVSASISEAPVVLVHTGCAAGEIAVIASVAGRGTHSLTLRPYNATVANPVETISLKGSKSPDVKWCVSVVDTDKPWGAVLFADSDTRPLAETFNTQ